MKQAMRRARLTWLLWSLIATAWFGGVLLGGEGFVQATPKWFILLATLTVAYHGIKLTVLAVARFILEKDDD